MDELTDQLSQLAVGRDLFGSSSSAAKCASEPATSGTTVVLLGEEAQRLATECSPLRTAFDHSKVHFRAVSSVADCELKREIQNSCESILGNKIRNSIIVPTDDRSFGKLMFIAAESLLDNPLCSKLLLLSLGGNLNFDFEGLDTSRILNVSLGYVTATQSAKNPYNIQLPIDPALTPAADLFALLWNMLLPIFLEYSPNCVLFALDSKSFRGSTESLLWLSHVTHHLNALSEGRLCCAFLEEKDASMEVLEAVADILSGGIPPAVPALHEISSSIRDCILRTVYSLREEWSSLHFQPLNGGPTHKRWPVFDPKQQCPLAAAGDSTGRTKLRNEVGLLALNRNRGRRLCLAYDTSMMRHRCEADSTDGYDDSGHPECPQRISSIFAHLTSLGLTDRCVLVSPPRDATVDELRLCHEQRHVELLHLIADTTQSERRRMEFQWDSVYISEHSNECAMRSAGYVIEAVDRVLNSNGTPESVRNAVCVVRPPGHHASAAEPAGFCLYNNVAIAAKYAVEMHGVKRVLIVDWDVHHGDGTQKITYEDPRILYLSLHRYDHGAFYPNWTGGDYNCCGEGSAAGFNVNIPWNTTSMGDAEYVSAFLKVVLPIGYEFGPDLVLISSGFDAASGDPLGGYRLSPSAYAWMTHSLMALAGGKLVLVLEGGYNLQSISQSMSACVTALLGDPLPPLRFSSNSALNDLNVLPSAWTTLRDVCQTQSEYWNSLKGFQVTFDYDKVETAVPAEAAALKNRKATPDLKKQKRAKKKTPNSAPAAANAQLPRRSPRFTHQKATSFYSEDFLEEFAQKDPIDMSDPTAANLNDPNSIAEFLGVSLERATELLGDDGQMPLYAVQPLSDCPHVTAVQPPPSTVDISTACRVCSNVGENWICLTCYQVHCSRFVGAHALEHEHGEAGRHPLALSFTDLSAWCYACNAYVHGPTPIADAKQVLYVAKFGHAAASEP